MESYLDNLKDISKFSRFKRLLGRGRWVSRVHESIFDHSFSIYPLLTNVALTYSYNLPNERMGLEELHYELMKRCNPRLLDLPFFNTSLNLHPLPAIENKIPGKINYKNTYLIKYYDYIMDYIEDNFELLKNILKEVFIKEMTKEKLFNNSMLSNILYNILQYVILETYDDFTDLKNRIHLNWSVSDDGLIDDYTENTLKAFIEYNMDIFNLKKYRLYADSELNKKQLENQSLKEQVIELDKKQFENQSLKDLIFDLNQNIDYIYNENNALKEEIALLNEDNKKLINNNIGLENKIEAIINSNSWKITKPLRIIKNK